MNVVIEFVTACPINAYKIGSSTILPARAFIDDLNLLCTSVPDAKALLFCCETVLKWAGMEFRPEKSRSIVLVKGRCVQTSPFANHGSNIVIPLIHDMPIKFLGRIIDGSLSSLDELEEKVNAGLDIISKSCFKPSQKLWILHHLLIPRIRWPLLIYEISITCAQKLERKITIQMRKWLIFTILSPTFAFTPPTLRVVSQ